METMVREGWTDGRLDEFERRGDERFAGLQGEMKQGFEQVDKRFEEVDRRFEQVDKRFEEVDRRFAQVDKRFEEVDKRFDHIDGRLDTIGAAIESVRNAIVFGAVTMSSALLAGLLALLVQS
ncbi:MAG TPA: hypothetical protein VFN92_10785 [Solirubrobacterales bacterium]|nr:hypothetical protein [Solirubrobacterales bacterium]